jgi:hypothetical protein
MTIPFSRRALTDVSPFCAQNNNIKNESSFDTREKLHCPPWSSSAYYNDDEPCKQTNKRQWFSPPFRSLLATTTVSSNNDILRLSTTPPAHASFEAATHMTADRLAT